MHRRNTQGLQAHADQKRIDTLEKAEAGIRTLLKARRPINFESVAEASGVSRTWLYRQPELRARIEHLRAQQAAQPGQATQKASAQSNSAMVRTVKAQNQKLQAQVQDLRQHLEVVHGRNLALQEQVDRLNRQIAMLQREGGQPGSPPITPSPSGAMPVEGADAIDAALQGLGIALNPTLRKTISASTPEGVLKAIAALQEAMDAGVVERPGGWLKRAIEQGWQPNGQTSAQSDLSDFDAFNRWFPEARTQGLVIASMRDDDGTIYVFTPDGQRVPFKDLYRQP